MVFDENLANRIRSILSKQKGVQEKKMFGGLTFMLNGHMSCGIAKDDLMVRVRQDQYQSLLKNPHARVMDLTGRPLKGFIFVNAKGYKTDIGLKFWINEAVLFAKSLPPKKKGAARKKKAY